MQIEHDTVMHDMIKNNQEIRRIQAMLEVVFNKIIMSEQPKISLERKRTLIQNLFTNDELKQLSEKMPCFGAAYLGAVATSRQTIKYKNSLL